MTFRRVRDLLPSDDLAAIWDSPQIATGRFPTWYTVFRSEPTTVEILTNQAVASVSGHGDDAWLQALAKRLCRMDDPEEAAAALAELRAYGAFLAADFQVKPISTQNDDTTPDFEVDAGDGPVTVEVFTKLQDKTEIEQWEDIRAGNTPPGVERRVCRTRDVEIGTTVSEMQPGGAPDPQKPQDSVQANVIQRQCGAKGKERQFPADKPCLLWIDMRNFGAWPEALRLEQCAPLISGRSGVTSGALWYAFYGWKGAPIFEEDFPLLERVFSLGHDGRFRMAGDKKSRLTGVIITLSEGLVLFENPWADHPLPGRARRFAERLPRFNLGYSLCAWAPGDAALLADAGRRQIEAMAQWREEFRSL
jgi:hypothetical protein